MKLEIFQFIFYTTLIMIIYEGTETIPILSQFIPDNKKLLLIIFSAIGISFYIIGINCSPFSGGVFII